MTAAECVFNPLPEYRSVDFTTAAVIVAEVGLGAVASDCLNERARRNSGAKASKVDSFAHLSSCSVLEQCREYGRGCSFVVSPIYLGTFPKTLLLGP